MSFASSPMPSLALTRVQAMSLRARQAALLGEIRQFCASVREPLDRASALSLLQALFARLCALLDEEEQALRLARYSTSFDHRVLHDELRAEIGAELHSLAALEPLPVARVAHLFDAFVIHQATAEADHKEVAPRAPVHGRRAAWAVQISANPAGLARKAVLRTTAGVA